MKKIKLFTAVLFLSLCTLHIQASHIVGLRITYDYVSPNVYLFKLKLYRDCSGIPAPISPLLCFHSASACSPDFTYPLVMDTLNSGFPVPFNSCASVGATFCQGGLIFAFEEYNYNALITVPSCSDWSVSFYECCRNAAITNLANPGGPGAYIETLFDNLNYPTNSSPEFNAVPINYYCAGVPSVVDYSAYDADGDSLSYEFTPIYDSPTGVPCSVPIVLPYSAPYTYTQPLAVMTPTTFDSYTGQINFTASQVQISVLGFKVNEYRNGVLIGSVRRDDEVVVVAPVADPDTIAGTVYYDLNTNNVMDGSDFAASGVLVHIGTGNAFASTFVNGKYLFETVPGAYNVDIPNPPLYTIPSPSSYTVTFASPNQFSGGNDFALQPVSNINDLEVNLNRTFAPIPGQIYPIVVSYNNAGTTNQTNVDVTLILDPALHFVSSVPTPSNINNNVITWSFASLNMFTGGIINVDALTDTTATLGDTIYCAATIDPTAGDNTPSNNADYFTDIVRTSCDPNYKTVTPPGDLPLSFVTSQGWLYYTIYFQNEGTAPANYVRVSDLLDNDLDIGSMELVAASKACVINLTSPNRIEFSFYNINLPPKSADEPHSHGFVQFRIKPKSSLHIGNYISNNAFIVFDFNAPVYTNTVYNMIVAPTGIQPVTSNSFNMNCFPNPAHDVINLELANNKTEVSSVNIMNMLGEKVFANSYRINNGFNQLSIPLKKLNPGVYFIELSKHDGKSILKFIIE